MNFDEKKVKCLEFFDKLAELLGDSYTKLPAINNDMSMYLVPKGTENQVSYYTKPELSFRVSDHWNWYANVRKCSDVNMIQCHCLDLPRPRVRNGIGKPSTPVVGIQVSIVGHDNKYHVIYGEQFDRFNRTWNWLEPDPESFVKSFKRSNNIR